MLYDCMHTHFKRYRKVLVLVDQYGRMHNLYSKMYGVYLRGWQYFLLRICKNITCFLFGPYFAIVIFVSEGSIWLL